MTDCYPPTVIGNTMRILVIFSPTGGAIEDGGYADAVII